MENFQTCAMQERYALAKQIYSDYMVPDSDFVISMPDAEYASTLATIQQYEATPSQIPVNMFTSALSIVMGQALDLYFRFFYSSTFQNYIAASEANLLDANKLEAQVEAS